MSRETTESEREFAFIASTTALMPGTRLTFHLTEDVARQRANEAMLRGDDLVVARTEGGASDGELPQLGTRAEMLDVARPHPSRLMAVVGGVERVCLERRGAEAGRVVGTPVEESSGMGRAARARAGDVLGLLQRLSEGGLEIAGDVRTDLDEASPSRVADVVGSVAFDDSKDHQRLLEERDVLERLGRVETQLDRLLGDLEAG